jgi:uncharacterized protein
MTTPTVVVRGTAVVPGEPDEVEIGLEITALLQTAEEALTDVARRSEILDALLTELDVPRKARSTSGVSVQEEREYQKDRHVFRGYRARNNVQVKLEDGTLIGRIMRLATERAQARIDGPYWRIALDNPARAEACRQAATDARRKAQAYAEALGVRLGAVVQVVEPGVHVSRPRHGTEFVVASAMDMDEAPEIRVDAGELDIPAVVEVTFNLEPE